MTIRMPPLRSLYHLSRLSTRSCCIQHRQLLQRQVVSHRTFAVSAAYRKADFDPRTIERESDEVDVCIVGGGPAGLSAAIRLKQLAAKQDREIRVLILEKGPEMGNSPRFSRFMS